MTHKIRVLWLHRHKLRIMYLSILSPSLVSFSTWFLLPPLHFNNIMIILFSILLKWNFNQRWHCTMFFLPYASKTLSQNSVKKKSTKRKFDILILEASFFLIKIKGIPMHYSRSVVKVVTHSQNVTLLSIIYSSYLSLMSTTHNF